MGRVRDAVPALFSAAPELVERAREIALRQPVVAEMPASPVPGAGQTSSVHAPAGVLAIAGAAAHDLLT